MRALKVISLIQFTALLTLVLVGITRAASTNLDPMPPASLLIQGILLPEAADGAFRWLFHVCSLSVDRASQALHFPFGSTPFFSSSCQCASASSVRNTLRFDDGISRHFSEVPDLLMTSRGLRSSEASSMGGLVAHFIPIPFVLSLLLTLGYHRPPSGHTPHPLWV